MSENFEFAQKIDFDSKIPVSRQIYAMIKEEIAANGFKSHEKLPSIRVLSSLLLVNKVTVVQAYKLLEVEGLIYTIKSSGCFVSPQKRMQIESEDLRDNSLMNFASLNINDGLFPRELLAKCFQNVFEKQGARAFLQSDENGSIELKKAIVSYLDRESVVAGAGEIVVTTSIANFAKLIAKTLLGKRDVVMVEETAKEVVKLAFSNQTTNVFEIKGLLPKDEDLELYIKNINPKLIYLTKVPSDSLMILAKERDIFVVIEDSNSEFGSDNGKKLKRSDKLIYIKSFSKLIVPNVGIVFALAIKEIAKKLFENMESFDIPNIILQKSLASFICDESFYDYIIGIRKYYYEMERYIFLEFEKSLEKYFEMEVFAKDLCFVLKPRKNNCVEGINELIGKNNVITIPTVYYKTGIEREIKFSFSNVSKSEIKFAFDILRELMEKQKG